MVSEQRNSTTQVLDHGYVTLIETWGSDERIIESARMSTNKGTLGWEAESTWRCEQCNYEMTLPHNDHHLIVEHEPMSRMRLPPIINERPRYERPIRHAMTYVSGHNGDARLLKFLYDNKHMTPFEFGGMTIEVQAPIFVLREWHRHRTQSYNEMSARYTPIPDVHYLPTVERLMMTDSKNKQAQSTGAALSVEDAQRVRLGIMRAYNEAQYLYETLLKLGVPKELARVTMPVGRYSRMRATANLRNWLGFLTLRMDSNAQWEIRQYANAVGELIAAAFPRTWQLFNVKGPTVTT